MKMHRSPSIKSQGDGRQDDKGFTLIEILIAIVLVGILSAVAVVGISNLVSKGSTSACSSTMDASKAAAAVYFASNNNAYPTSLQVLAASGALTLPTNVTATANVATGAGWTLTMTPVVGAAPTFTCSTP